MPGLQFSKVSYITIRIDSKESSEYEDFHKRMDGEKKNKIHRDEINRFIQSMGEIYGAQDKFFKGDSMAGCSNLEGARFIESEAGDGFGVCLSCLCLSQELVMLLNGDRRTTSLLNDCPICGPHQLLARKVSSAFYRARINGHIIVSGKDILADDGYVLEL